MVADRSPRPEGRLTTVRDLAFHELLERRTVFLHGPIDGTSAAGIAAQLLALDGPEPARITLLIDSPGGDLSGLFTIHDTMVSLRSPVDTVCLGMAASAAAVLLAAGTGVRAALPNARIMLHQPHGGIPTGTARDIEIAAQEFLFLKRRLEELLAERTGKPIDTIRADTDRDLWLAPADALAYGLIDEIRERAVPERTRPVTSAQPAQPVELLRGGRE